MNERAVLFEEFILYVRNEHEVAVKLVTH